MIERNTEKQIAGRLYFNRRRLIDRRVVPGWSNPGRLLCGSPHDVVHQLETLGASLRRGSENLNGSVAIVPESQP